MPYVQSIPKNSPIGQQLPPALKQQWILGIHNEEPIHAQSAHEELTRLRTSHANKKIKLIMAPRVIDHNNKYEEQRTKFDQMRPIIASATTLPMSRIKQDEHPTLHHKQKTTINTDTILQSDISGETPTTLDTNAQENKQGSTTMTESTEYIPTISVLVHLSIRPTTTSNIQNCFDSTNPLRSFWIQTNRHYQMTL